MSQGSSNRRVTHLMTYTHTVDGRHPANQLRLAVYLTIYRVYMSQVVQDVFHRQYVTIQFIL